MARAPAQRRLETSPMVRAPGEEAIGEFTKTPNTQGRGDRRVHQDPEHRRRGDRRLHQDPEHPVQRRLKTSPRPEHPVSTSFETRNTRRPAVRTTRTPPVIGRMWCWRPWPEITTGLRAEPSKGLRAPANQQPPPKLKASGTISSCQRVEPLSPPYRDFALRCVSGDVGT